MKVMVLAPYIYDRDIPEFTRNKTGLGIMIRDIVISIGELADTILVTRVITHVEKNHKGNYKIMPHTWKTILKSAFFMDWVGGVKKFLTSSGGLKNRARQAFYVIDNGYVRKQIQEQKPDFVHIHGIGSITEGYIQVCEELNIKYMVTLHGLIGLNDSVTAPAYDKKLERDFLIESEQKHIPVSVISSGMKKRIEDHYLGHKAANISVITNGTWIPANEEKQNLSNWKERYHFSDRCKICVVIGSIIQRKNQMQIVEAYSQLPEQVKKTSVIFMCGRDMTDGAIGKRIEELALSERIFVMGFMEQVELTAILGEAYLNIVASLDEGFGLSIIEAYSHGVPTVTFSDLDAVADLYDEKTMLLVKSRGTNALAQGLQEALKKEWDREYILNYSKKFSMEKMANKYIEGYKKIMAGV